jgi:uncharacterized protein YjcR
MGLKRTDLRLLAKELFLHGTYTQKEIAAKVGVTEKSISKWANDEKWDKLKSALIMTREAELRKMYIQLQDFNEYIEQKPKGQRFGSSKEYDALSKLTSCIRNMESEVAIADMVSCFTRMNNWLRRFDIEKAKEFVEIQDSFLKSLL